MNKVIFLRGCSGSGKSYLANSIKNKTISENGTAEIVSADNFFMKNGKYNWSGKYIKYAHAWCFGLFVKELINETNVVIVDNTFIEAWTFYQYIEACKVFEYEWDILEPKTKWARNPEELAKRNQHNVPIETIKKMLSGLEKLSTTQLKKDLQEKFA